MTKRCRLCLETNAEDYYSLHEEYKAGPTYADFIQQLAGVEIEFDDGLPQEICEDCYCEIQRILEFSSGVRRADEELRNELNSVKRQKDSTVLENKYYTQGNEMCAMEDVLELDTDNQESFVVEEIHEGEEIHLVEEILRIDNEVITDEVIIDEVITDEDTKPCLQKEDLLVELAHVAATQDNVDVIDKNATNPAEYSKDENDEDYLIEFDPNETLRHNFKPPKWKCGECKVVLRGDVSYEGHMNMHKQLRPHKCGQCNWDFRCRTALKKHQEIRHTSRTNLELNAHEKNFQTSSFCEECKISFVTEVKCYLHEIMVHKKYTDISTCPFCSNIVENIKEHIQKSHNDYNVIENTFNNDNTLNSANTSISTVWQCNICSKIYHSLELLSNHQKLCQKTDEQQTHDIKVVYLDDIPTSTTVEYLENVPTTNNAKDSSENASVQCEVCKRKLLRRNLTKHMELHNRKDETRKYLCAHCHISFTTDEDLNEHFNLEHLATSHLLECKQCHVSFADIKLLKEHGKINHKYKCKLCGNTFRGHAQLSAHKRLHKERPFKCDQCDKAYPRKVELDIHMRTHTGELPYACHLCDKRFAVKVRLTYHLQKHEGVIHPCSYCSAVYDNRNKLKAHLFKHTGMPYKCELCPGLGFDRRIRFANHMQRKHKKTLTEEELSKVFAKNTGKTIHFKDPAREKSREFLNTKSLRQHERTHPGESSDLVYICGDCDRQYSSECLLETHRKQAHKERDNICPICGNAFKLKNQLVNHMKLHLEKNIQCPHCDKKYARQFDLNVHLRSHTGEQPFACHLCDKRFAIKVRLTYHLQKHYGIKHQCKECGAEFNSKQKLKAHSFKHTGMPYRCELCDDHGFATRNVFKRHLNRVHHATISDEDLNEMFQQNTGKTVNIKQVSELGLVQTTDDENEDGQGTMHEKTIVLGSPVIFMEAEDITNI